MKTADPVLWNQLVNGKAVKLPGEKEIVTEDKEPDDEFANTAEEDLDADDCDLALKTVLEAILNNKKLRERAKVTERSPGALMSKSMAEDPEIAMEEEDVEAAEANEDVEAKTRDDKASELRRHTS